MNFTRPNILALLAFEGAEFFGEEDREGSASATDALGYLKELLEYYPVEEDAEAWLSSAEAYWAIAAYKRDKVSVGQIQIWAEWHTEMLREAYGEEHGDDEGDDRLSDEDKLELERRLRDVVHWYCTQATCCRLQQLKLFELLSADLRELVEQLHPEWLNKPEASASNGEP